MVAARALLRFLGRRWVDASPEATAGAMLLSEGLDNLRCLKKFADDYRKATRKRGRSGGRGRRRRR